MEKIKTVILTILRDCGIAILRFLLMLAGELLGTFLTWDMSLSPVDWVYTVSFYIETIGIWIVLILWIVIFRKNRPILKSLWKDAKGNNAKSALAGLGIGFLTNAVCIGVACLEGDITLTFSSFRPLPLIIAFIAVFIQSSEEELLCRGFMYQRFIRVHKGNPVFPIALTATFFAALHLLNPGVTVLSELDIFLFGLTAAFSVYFLDSIWFAFFYHAGWNYTQAILFGLPNSGLSTPFSLLTTGSVFKSGFAYDIYFGVEGGMLAVILEICVCTGVYIYGTRHGIIGIDIWKKGDKTDISDAETPSENI